MSKTGKPDAYLSLLYDILDLAWANSTNYANDSGNDLAPNHRQSLKTVAADLDHAKGEIAHVIRGRQENTK